MTTRIGIFGGTFDPVHVGHLVTAVNVRHLLGLDFVLLVVANEPWQKAGRALTPALDRLAMVEAAVADVEGLRASSLEIERGGPSYTADTLAEITRRWPVAQLFLVLGSDSAAGLHTWERVEEVRVQVELVVVDRPKSTLPPLPKGWTGRVVEVPRLDISSTDLRARLAEGRPVRWLLPEPVIRLVEERGLYAVRG